jgi:allene oxide cyclase
MGRALPAAVAAALVSAGTIGVAAHADGGSTAASDGTRTLALVERAATDVTVDVGDKGDSTGDLLTFHNRLFDRRDRRQVGRDLGHCVRIVPGRSYDCEWTAFLRGGHISAYGPFYDKRDSVLAITGGTGVYRRARGVLRLHARSDGASFDFVYRVSDVAG